MQKHSTGGSRVIPQHSTNPAQTRLTSEIGRDRVLSGWYDRAMNQGISRPAYHQYSAADQQGNNYYEP